MVGRVRSAAHQTGSQAAASVSNRLIRSASTQFANLAAAGQSVDTPCNPMCALENISLMSEVTRAVSGRMNVAAAPHRSRVAGKSLRSVELAHAWGSTCGK
jgi:hypothetical protein